MQGVHSHARRVTPPPRTQGKGRLHGSLYPLLRSVTVCGPPGEAVQGGTRGGQAAASEATCRNARAAAPPMTPQKGPVRRRATPLPARGCGAGRKAGRMPLPALRPAAPPPPPLRRRRLLQQLLLPVILGAVLAARIRAEQPVAAVARPPALRSRLLCRRHVVVGQLR